MMRSLFTSAGGMQSMQFHVDVTANNLANVNTWGYKRVRVDFQDLISQTLRGPGALSAGGQMLPTGMSVGLGVRPARSIEP